MIFKPANEYNEVAEVMKLQANRGQTEGSELKTLDGSG